MPLLLIFLAKLKICELWQNYFQYFEEPQQSCCNFVANWSNLSSANLFNIGNEILPRFTAKNTIQNTITQKILDGISIEK